MDFLIKKRKMFAIIIKILHGTGQDSVPVEPVLCFSANLSPNLKHCKKDVPLKPARTNLDFGALVNVGEVYAHVMRHLRTRLRFALLRATLVAVRGYRGQKGRSEELEIEDISFNLIPEMKDF